MTSVVRVTHHALEQALTRFPGWFRGLKPHVAHQVIASDVRAAIAEQRMSSRQPRWSIRAGTNGRGDARHRRSKVRGRMVCDIPGGGRHQSSRFVWTEDRTRVYLIARTDHRVVVVTTIAPGSLEEAA